MMEKIRSGILKFIESDKDTPFLAGFSVGIYMLLFYYSKNFALANSWHMFFFFFGYYVIMPMLTLYIAFKIASRTKFHVYKKNLLFVGVIGFLSFFLLQINNIGFSKKLVFVILLLAACLLSIKFKKYYKLLAILLLFISLFNVYPLLYIAKAAITSTNSWKTQPDDIVDVKFQSKPNVYYIQPDGYTNFDNLKNNKYYRLDNSRYTTFLKQMGFVLYDDYRSNYPSTLLSNSATFSMKHHYAENDVSSYAAREIIVGDNPVLKIFKNNGYQTNFITENPYLLINRPEIGYDHTNIKLSDIPYLKDGFGIKRDVAKDLKIQMANSKGKPNFYFVEKFTPGHIHVYETASEGKEEEQRLYLKSLKDANTWLQDIITHIEIKDPSAIIIIGADHGGFTGFKNTLQSHEKTTDHDLIKSIFGAHLAIKWNDTASGNYDYKLKTGVNLFRTVFSYLARDREYLDNLEDNSSYMPLNDPKGLYKYIGDNDAIVFEKKR